jgi:hypothetical protein
MGTQVSSGGRMLCRDRPRHTDPGRIPELRTMYARGVSRREVPATSTGRPATGDLSDEVIQQ